MFRFFDLPHWISLSQQHMHVSFLFKVFRSELTSSAVSALIHPIVKMQSVLLMFAELQKELFLIIQKSVFTKGWYVVLGSPSNSFLQRLIFFVHFRNFFFAFLSLLVSSKFSFSVPSISILFSHNFSCFEFFLSLISLLFF